jgi:hypothetical protein
MSYLQFIWYEKCIGLFIKLIDNNRFVRLYLFVGQTPDYENPLLGTRRLRQKKSSIQKQPKCCWLTKGEQILFFNMLP